MTRQNRIFEEIAVVICTITIVCVLAINLNNSTSNINEITGNAISRANISPLREYPCNMTFESGLNLVSFFCITYDTNRSAVIGEIENLQAIFEYQEGASDKWKVYNPTLPSWVIQDLTTMSRTEGYYIQMSDTEHEIIDGGLRVPTNINLQPGWNLVGYPTNQTKESNGTAFTSISGNFTEVRLFNASTQSYLSFTPPNSGGLRYIIPNHGYWLNSTTEVWTVD